MPKPKTFQAYRYKWLHFIVHDRIGLPVLIGVYDHESQIPEVKDSFFMKVYSHGDLKPIECFDFTSYLTPLQIHSLRLKKVCSGQDFLDLSIDELLGIIYGEKNIAKNRQKIKNLRQVVRRKLNAK